MESLWGELVAHCSDFVLYAVAPTVVVNLAYLLGALASLLLDRIPSLARYKIQSHYHGRAALLRLLRHLTVAKLLGEIPMTFAAYPIFVWLGVKKDLPLPGAASILLFLAAAFVVEDAWHYFAHRALHTRWGYRKIHFMHHELTTPFGPAANYAHPLETLFTGFGTVLPVLLVRPHLYTMLIWIVARQLQAVSVHVGYDLPWRPSRLLPLVGGARFHDRHHRRFNRNYAPTFVWLDRLLGTADEVNLGPRPAGAAEPPVVIEE